ncbi:MAG: type II toxin-antitoxin system prevent-host-death family antitoxin [Sulfuritalea sp.]|nr:type II toxin-antitoxin system prevent-host-death family antitoxin [Sulfuritalea sp.]
MHGSQWRLQDAKTQFSQVVDAALQGEPQHVTRRGREAVVVLSEANYRALREGARATAPGFVAHLLAIPKDDAPQVEPSRVALRDIDL